MMELKSDLRHICKIPQHITSDPRLEIVSVDISGRLPGSEGFEYILSMVDIASRFVMKFHLRKASTI